MQITIRAIAQKDFVRLIELFKEFAVFEKQPGKMINTYEKMVDEKAYFNGFVAETADKTIVGYATYFLCYYTWVGKSLYLDDLYVTPDYRGVSVGTTLINHLIDFAKENKCQRMRWQVSSWNVHAISFYKKLGADIDNIEQNCDINFIEN